MARKTIGKNSYAGGCGAMAKPHGYAGGCGCGSGGGCKGGCGPGCGCGPCEQQWGPASAYAGAAHGARGGCTPPCGDKQICVRGKCHSTDIYSPQVRADNSRPSRKALFRRHSRGHRALRRMGFAGAEAQEEYHIPYIHRGYPTGGPDWAPYRAPSGPTFAPYWGGPHYNCCSPTPKTKPAPTQPTPTIPTQPPPPGNGLTLHAVPIPTQPPPPPGNGLLLQAVPIPTQPPPPPSMVQPLTGIPVPTQPPPPTNGPLLLQAIPASCPPGSYRGSDGRCYPYTP